MYSERDLSESNVEKVTRILESSNFEDLTPETLLLAYQEEGIRSLEDLTERITAVIKDPKGRPQRINYEASFKPAPREFLEKIKHEAPDVPFIVKGVEYDPEDIVRFNGKELLFIADARPWSSELIVLEDKNVWSSFLQTNILATLLARNGTVVRHEPRNWEVPELRPGVDVLAGAGRADSHPDYQKEQREKEQREEDGRTGSVSSPWVIGPGVRWLRGITDDVYMFTQTDWFGYELELGPGLIYPQLSNLPIWLFDDWNDAILSISPTNSFCLFGEHSPMDPGSKLFFNYTHYGYRDLTIGTPSWGNKISSVWNVGPIAPGVQIASKPDSGPGQPYKPYP